MNLAIHCISSGIHLYCMVTELCAGTVCYNPVDGQCQGPEGKNIVLRQIPSGLNKLHNKNVIHQDLKPGNFLF